VPRPPNAGGVYTGPSASPAQSAHQTQPGMTTHTAPRPPEYSGDANVRGSRSPAETATPNSNSNAMHGAAQPRSVPRPPAAAEVQRAPAAVTPSVQTPHAPSSTVRESAPPARQSAPPTRSAPESKPRGEKPNSASAVPRPPSSYTYHAAPAYVASAGNRSSVPYDGGASSYGRSSYVGGSYTPSPSYGTRPGSYSPAPSYANHGTSYSATPSYRSAYRPPTTYAIRNAPPSTPHYSAPSSYSGGSGHSSVPSGGGSHASHGGGGHTR